MISNLLRSLFARKKVTPWELEFLKSVFLQMEGAEYKKLYAQVEDGVLVGVMIGCSYRPNYVGFVFGDSRKYENRRSASYCLSGIRVKDAVAGSMLPVTIFVYDDLIAGYHIDVNWQIKKYQFDPSVVDISKVRKAEKKNKDLGHILYLLNDEECKWIDQDVYPVELEDKEYFHIRELEDGDFLAIDMENSIYKITHDPYEIMPLDREKLLEFLQQPIEDFYV